VGDAIPGAGLDATLRDFSGGQKIFNRYTLTKVLGRGGMGIVWLARDDELERDVALKFLPELLVLDRGVLGDLKRETKRSLELTHKNIVRIYDFVHDDISGAISMEFIDGDTLSNLRADQPNKVFEPADLKDMLTQLCDALDYAHNHAGIVHRDLKPANLMVNKRSQLKIADFGIARSLSDSMSMLTHAHGTSGTLVYMSPQQLDGERGTHLDDVYSVGATIYELITSRPPFYSGNIDRQIHEKIPPLMAQRRKDLDVGGNPIPQEWEETIAACLAKDPAKRPQSVSEVAHRLQLASQQLQTIPSSREISSRKKGLIAVCVFLVVLAGATAWILFSHHKQAPVTEASTTVSEAEAGKEYVLGSQYFRGGGDVLIDHKKAFQRFTRSAENGFPEAQARLADMYELDVVSQDIVLKDKAKAADWAKKALASGLEAKAERGAAGAEYELASLYFLGLGVARDETKAASLAQSAADHGNIDAKRLLGYFYLHGRGVKNDENKGETYLREAAAENVAPAQNLLGLQYKDKDPTKAAEMFRRAAEQGNASAQYFLGDLYEKGKGVEQSYVRAAEYYQKSADHMFWAGLCSLAALYEKGNGVPKDLSKATALYQKAADQGIQQAKDNLRRLEQTQSSVASVTPSVAAPSTPSAPSGTLPFALNAGYNPAIAFVDMNRVFKEYTKTKDAEEKINEAKAQAKREYDDRSNAYKKALDEINYLNKQLDSSGLSADAKSRTARDRDNKIANIKNMEREVTEFRTTREKQLQEQTTRMREGIVSEMRAKIGSLDARANNLIFDKSGNSLNGVPVILFSPSNGDASNAVVAGLNQNRADQLLSMKPVSVGLVDMNRIFRAYNRTKDAESKINQAKGAAKKDYDDRAAFYQKALDEINSLNKQIDSSGLSGDAKSRMARDRDNKIANVKKMEKEITEFKTTREKQLQDQALKMREGIVAEITKLIASGLAMINDGLIIDVSGNSKNGVPVVVYSEGIPDFSNYVISALNQNKPSTTFSQLVSSASARFGIVDMNRAFKQWPDTKEAEAKINDAKAQAKREYDDRANAYKKALDEINSLNTQLNAPGLDTNARSTKARERDNKILNIKNMEREINEFRTSREKQLQEDALKMREGIVLKIRATVNQIAEADRCNLVLDSSGNSLNDVPIVLLSRDVPDITDKVLAAAQR